MNDERDFERLERLLHRAASDLREELPPTPPIAAAVRVELARRPAPARPRVRWVRIVAIAAGAILIILLLSPDARDAAARFFGLNTVRVQQVPTLEAPAELPVTAVPIATQSAIQSTAPLASPAATPGPAGLTTLALARERARFAIRLPTYPDDLGAPQRVYFQAFDRDFGNGAQQVILVYPDFALYQAEDVIYQKSIGEATTVEEVTVNGQPGLWLTGATHLIQVQTASGAIELDFARLVGGNVLAWEGGDVTYRIETTLPLEEALRIAESIQ